MHFDGVTEQLCKVTRERLKKFLECRSKWAKLKCQQAEIAKKSYENIDDGSVNSPDWNLCCAGGSSSPRNFDAFYIFTIEISKSFPHNFQTFQSGQFIHGEEP